VRGSVGYWASLAGAVCVALAPAVSQARPARYAAEIVRTTHGIPHITARDWRGIGYGVAYSYAQDNLCLLAEEFVTLAGERSRHFGPEATSVIAFDPVPNLAADTFFRAMIDIEALRAGFARTSAASQQMREGYVAGYNRLLRDIGPAGVPEACRGKPWVRPITLDDMLRLGEKQAMLAASLALAPAVAAAAPPAAVAPGAAAPGPQSRLRDVTISNEIGFGSNGWAFGAETTANGRGVLVGNPHFPWNGTARFYQMHVTIPGQVDVMGASLGGGPFPTIGFTRDVAWTHTVTAARHFTIHELTLDPADPTVYLVDGRPQRMTTRTVTIPMPDGTAPVTRTLYATRYGPMLVNPAAGLTWTGERAFAMRDANRGNQRLLDTWLAIVQARSVREVKAAVSTTLGIPWVNTIAADRHGDVLLADITAVPNVSAAQIRRCATPRSAAAAARFVLLDGSRSVCDWTVAPGTAEPGLMPASDQASFLRRDYVANSNDSYWLTNPAAPHPQLSPILGPAGTERTLRTRSGLIEIGRRLAGTDGLPGNRVDQETAKAMAFANISLAADMVVPPLLELCAGQADLEAACTALRNWDRRYELDSRGAYLFHVFWEGAVRIPGRWAVPFDPADPVNTPRDLVTTGAQRDALLAALRAAVARLASENIALDAPWGTVQAAVRGAERIPVHGADGGLGVLNLQRSVRVPGGLLPVHGTSYIQVVSFDARGPVADAILSYSQSTDPASPFYADQTRNYAAKRWHRLPFTRDAIARAAIGPAVRIAE
jgi:acyl-homoserine-lactone acylase